MSKNEYKIPELSYQGELVSVLEFPIKHLFEKTSANIEFIHKSIYEYFASEYIYNSIADILNKDVNIEIDLAGVFGSLLKNSRLSSEILDFLKYKIRNKLNENYDILHETFQLMLRDGMTYFTNKCYRNAIKCEMNVFANMLEILHLWEDCCLEFDDKICDYLRHNSIDGLNLRKVKSNFNKSKSVINNDNMDKNMNKIFLRGANLSGANLSGANLKGINLSGASLIGANLRFACLANSNLSFADLQKADLLGADLTYVDMKRTVLRETILNGADIRFARLEEVDFRGAEIHLTKFDEKQIKYIETQCELKGTRTRVYIYNIKKIVSYEDYCKLRRLLR